MAGSINSKTLTDVFRMTSLLALCLTAALAAAMTPAGAQHLDPPLGWDIWDPTWPEHDVWEEEDLDLMMRWRIERHRAYIERGVPEAYRDVSNPVPRLPGNLEGGHALYVEHCASCHDATGQGRGEAGLALYPSPALLAHLIRMPSRVDEYLLWSIADGGEAFATDMPAFKDTLDREKIWHIITYMRAGFPDTGGEAKE
ncbi:MAG: c-type cytochrome [Geminicoccaceae bacterium]